MWVGMLAPLTRDRGADTPACHLAVRARRPPMPLLPLIVVALQQLRGRLEIPPSLAAFHRTARGTANRCPCCPRWCTYQRQGIVAMAHTESLYAIAPYAGELNSTAGAAAGGGVAQRQRSNQGAKILNRTPAEPPLPPRRKSCCPRRNVFETAIVQGPMPCQIAPPTRIHFRPRPGPNPSRSVSPKSQPYPGRRW